MKVREGFNPADIKKLTVIKMQEKLTTREWREMMGENKDRYKRVNGAVRRR